MPTYHVTAIGWHEGAVRIERRLEAADPQKAAQRGLWLAETAGIRVNSLLTRREHQQDGQVVKEAPRVHQADSLRQPVYGATISSRCATINAGHLPADEREDLTHALFGETLPGVVGQGAVMLHASKVSVTEIEEELPILSSLVQIAQDEGVEWLVLSVDGQYLEGIDLHPEGV